MLKRKINVTNFKESLGVKLLRQNCCKDVTRGITEIMGKTFFADAYIAYGLQMANICKKVIRSCDVQYF